MTAKDGVEREAKLSVWAGFIIPELTEVVPGIVAEALPAVHLSAVYFDTADLRLARRGVTLRYRVDASGETGERGWSLKLASSESSGTALSRTTLIRTELSFAGGPTRPPAAAESLVRAFARSLPLQPVGKLVTRRSRWALRVGEGGPVAAEIDDDEVSVHEGRRVATRFREIEVEEGPAADEAPGVLAAVVSVLTAGGAGAADPLPKLVRALGPRASAPPSPAAPDTSALSGKSPAGDVVRAAIGRAVTQLIAHDAGVRLDEHDEDVHQARVATRRLRSDLDTFRLVLDRDWVRWARTELAWLADTLGAVRDADVLSAKLAKAVAALAPPDAEAAGALLDTLAAQRVEHRAALLAAYASPRYVALLDALVDAADSPPWATRLVAAEADPGVLSASAVMPEASEPTDGIAGTEPIVLSASAVTPETSEPTEASLVAETMPLVGEAARTAVPLMVRTAADTLAKAVGKLGKRPDDEALHDVRRKAKRCRYAVEAAVPVVGKDAARLAKAVAAVQEVLGGLQDGVVAETWLRAAAADAPPATALAAGLLVAAEHARMDQARQDWRAAWAKSSAKSLWAWLP